MATFTGLAQVEHLAAIRCWLEDAAAELGADISAVQDLVQATDEAATNVCVHGYAGAAGPIEIELTRQADDLVVRLRDWAPHFDPAVIGPPDLSLPLEARPMGGLGIFMIRSLTDRMQYRALTPGGNELTLFKKAF